MGIVIQLKPRLPTYGRDKPASIHEVVEGCVAHLDANASLDDLTAEVRSLVGPDVYEAWAGQAFRAVVSAITKELSGDASLLRSSGPSDAGGIRRRVSLVK